MIFFIKNILTQEHKYDRVNMEGIDGESVANAERFMSSEQNTGRHLQIGIHAVKTFLLKFGKGTEVWKRQVNRLCKRENR